MPQGGAPIPPGGDYGVPRSRVALGPRNDSGGALDLRDQRGKFTSGERVAAARDDVFGCRCPERRRREAHELVAHLRATERAGRIAGDMGDGALVPRGAGDDVHPCRPRAGIAGEQVLVRLQLDLFHECHERPPAVAAGVCWTSHAMSGANAATAMQ